MSKSDKIWCPYVVVNCVGLRTFWTPLVHAILTAVKQPIAEVVFGSMLRRNVLVRSYRPRWLSAKREFCAAVSTAWNSAEQSDAVATLCPEKRDQMYLVISSTKLGRFCWNLVHSFLNKYAAKSPFPPRLNTVSALPCKILNANCACAAIELSRKETNFIPPQHFKFARFESIDYSMWEIPHYRLIGIRFQLDDVSAWCEVSLGSRCKGDVSGLTEYLKARSNSFLRTIQLRQASCHCPQGSSLHPRSHFMSLPAASQRVDYIATDSTATFFPYCVVLLT